MNQPEQSIGITMTVDCECGARGVHPEHLGRCVVALEKKCLQHEVRIKDLLLRLDAKDHVPKIRNRKVAAELLEVILNHFQESGDSAMGSEKDNIHVMVKILEARHVIEPNGTVIQYLVD